MQHIQKLILSLLSVSLSLLLLTCSGSVESTDDNILPSLSPRLTTSTTLSLKSSEPNKLILQFEEVVQAVEDVILKDNIIVKSDENDPLPL